MFVSFSKNLIEPLPGIERASIERAMFPMPGQHMAIYYGAPRGERGKILRNLGRVANKDRTEKMRDK